MSEGVTGTNISRSCWLEASRVCTASLPHLNRRGCSAWNWEAAYREWHPAGNRCCQHPEDRIYSLYIYSCNLWGKPLPDMNWPFQTHSLDQETSRLTAQSHSAKDTAICLWFSGLAEVILTRILSIWHLNMYE
jgi:hypothetical protein